MTNPQTVTTEIDTEAAERKKRRAERRKERARLLAKCEKILGQKVRKVEYPGGKSRRSFRLVLGDKTPVIVSVRPREIRASTERKVLRALAGKAAVPALLGSDGHHVLLQEEIRGVRLAKALHGATPRASEEALDAALTSLADAQQAGSAAGFDDKITRVGTTFEWVAGLLDRPAVIGNYFEIPAARPDLRALEELLAIRRPRFVKWDARPGNAMLARDGQVYWFDWEHCAARNRLDDVAWLMGDEYLPDHPEAETRLIEKHLPRFADDLSIDEARTYLYAYGVFHMTVRLGLICKYKERGDWWDHDYCVERDKVGVSLISLRRLCLRGERWARETPYTEVLAPWFRAIRTRFERESQATLRSVG